MTTLHAREITVRFGGLTAVDEATLEVSSGEIVGLIGPNGAGKTTLFNVLGGFQPTTAGRVFIDDRDVTATTASARARLGIGRTFQRLELFGRMTVFDNLLVAAEAGASRLDLFSDLLNLPRRRREEERCGEIARRFLSMLGLGDVALRNAADLPIGTARILELARALCTAPEILLLDEPSSGLDSDETRAFGAMLHQINRELGIGILIVEHDVDLVTEVTNRIYVLDFGRMIAQGSPSEIMHDAAVRTAYLGEEDDATSAPAPQR
ncbi:MAG: ABC transporter ATP-binding protein [Actinobacteria bacterium]|nr:ABC transporter ATP-binding protein [Actinomycetota bacterium]